MSSMIENWFDLQSMIEIYISVITDLKALTTSKSKIYKYIFHLLLF